MNVPADNRPKGKRRSWRPGRLRFCALGLLLGLAVPSPLWACATCFGRSDDAMARGMNMGILSLLLVVLFVLAGLGAFAIFLARRAARFAAPVGEGDAEASREALVDSLSQPLTK